MLGVMAGGDPSDPASVERPVPDYIAALERADLDGLRIGIAREFHFPEGADPAALESINAAAKVFASLGATVLDVALPMYHEVTAATMVTMMPESLAHHRAKLIERGNDYFAGTRENVYPGLLISGADYVQGLRVRRLGQRALAEFFRTVDVVVTPTASVGAFSYATIEDYGLLPLVAHLHNTYWNGVGNPVLAVPTGFTVDGLPLGMQLSGRPFDEVTILRAGHAFQQATEWHRACPPIPTPVAT
jgi:aspartyl-tRNA(Asn)/glutamyl-tRNA(Gln) amidotransferase subunit A